MGEARKAIESEHGLNRRTWPADAGSVHCQHAEIQLQGGAELDLLVSVGGKRHGFEFEYSDAPATTRSMHVAIDDLGLECLWVIYPGHDEYDLTQVISVAPVESEPRLAGGIIAP